MFELKITDVQVTILGYRYPKPVVFAHLKMDVRKIALVRILTDEGIVGIGDTDAEPTGDSVVKDIILRRFRPLLIGEDPLNIGYLWDKLHAVQRSTAREGLESFALSAVDVALWDVLGKAVNKPVSVLLGRRRDEIPAYASWSYLTPDDVVEKMERTRAEGYGGAKIRIGVDPARDIALVSAAREALGSDRDLMVDVNSGWSRADALRNAKALERFSLKWIEEPVDPRDIDAYRELRKGVATPIALGEHHNSQREFVELLKAGAGTVYQPDVRAGGISECMKIANMVNSWGFQVALHCFGSAIKYAATLQMMASIHNSYYLEWNMNECPLKTALVENPIVVEAGMVRIPDRPGIGVVLNETAVQEYTLVD